MNTESMRFTELASKFYCSVPEYIMLFLVVVEGLKQESGIPEAWLLSYKIVLPESFFASVYTL